MNDTSTQSVCKHCGQLCDPNKPKYHIDYRYDGHDAEPISEPASTGEPPTLKPIPEGWSGWRTVDGEPLKDAPYGPNGMEGDYGL